MVLFRKAFQFLLAVIITATLSGGNYLSRFAAKGAAANDSRGSVVQGNQPGNFQLLSATTGWVLSGGQLFRSPDGGQTWSMITPPEAQSVWTAYFLNELEGWAVTSVPSDLQPGASKVQLATTRDGGETWERSDLVFDPFPDLPGAQPESVKLLFQDTQNGLLTFKRPTSSNFNVLAGFQTTDGGRTWQALTNPEPGIAASDPAAGPGEATQRQVDMLDDKIGWALETNGVCQADLPKSAATCTQSQSLFHTQDGGQTWIPLALPASSVSPAPLEPELVTTGQAFDKCEVASLSQLQTWWDASPYQAVNLYIGGSLRACSNQALNADYLSEIDRQGWTLIPTWVGPQAACSGYSQRINYDPNKAFQQGIDEANAASQAAQNLRLWGQALYYDLESFETANEECLESAKAFIDAWSGQLHANGFVAGVYGSPCRSGLPDFWYLENAPEAVWIANWYLTPAYNPNASVWDIYCMDSSYWPNHQRLRQYAGGHDETWGSVTMNIDSNVMDGIVAQAYGQSSQICPRPSTPAAAGVILYTSADYDCGGRQAEFGYAWRGAPGFYNLGSFFDGRASSIYLPGGWSARLYENLNGAGGQVCLSNAVTNFAGMTFNNGHALNDQVSSMEVFTALNCGSGAGLQASDIQPPQVSIINHLKSGYLNAANTSPVVIQANLADTGSGVSHAQFFAGYSTGGAWNWQNLGWDVNGGDGWSANWNPSTTPDQTEIGLYVYGWDQAGNGAGVPVLHLTLDRIAPFSVVQALPATLDRTAIHVAWSGSDSLSGLGSFDIQIQDNGGAWQNWLSGVSASTLNGTYYGQLGHSYGFRSRAIDKAGNQETYPASADATTKVNLCDPDAYEPDNAIMQAGTLDSGQAQAHSICGIGDQDWAVFSAQAGQSFFFVTRNLSPDTDTWLGVYDAQGNLLAENDNRGSTDPSSMILFHPNADGLVYLKATNTDARLAGNGVTYDLLAVPAQNIYLPLLNK